MLIENEFRATAPVEELWAFLLNVERIAPCMPGAELTEVVDDRTWKGKVSMKFGPVAMVFAGTVVMQDRDDAAHRVVLSAKGMEQKGKGAANASVTSWLEPAGDGTSVVKMRADISLTGAAAQLSRGLMPEVSKKLTQQFADCLEQTLAASEVLTSPVPDESAATALIEVASPPPAAGPDPPELAQLWREWKSSASPVAREGLILHYVPLVTYVASRVATGLQVNVEQVDLVSYGMFGLMDALEDFEPGRGNKFETYAIPRIEGAIIDELRAMGRLPRSTPSKTPAPAKPVGGIGLGLSAIWAIVKNFFRRLVGGSRSA